MVLGLQECRAIRYSHPSKAICFSPFEKTGRCKIHGSVGESAAPCLFVSQNMCLLFFIFVFLVI